HATRRSALGHTVRRHDALSELPEGGEGRASIPLPTLVELRGSYADVIADQIPRDVREGLVPRDAPGSAPHDERELDFVVHGGVVRGDDDVVIGAVDRARRLVEED